MVVIRLSRAGAKKRPFYHICVSDKRRKRDGSHIEKIGFYNPVANSKEQTIKLDKERYDYWKSVGAKSSETVEMLVKRSLLTPEEIEQIENKKSEKLNKRKAKLLLKEKEKIEGEAPAEAETPAEASAEAETPAEAEAEASAEAKAEAPAEAETPAEAEAEAPAEAETPAEEQLAVKAEPEVTKEESKKD